MNHRMNFMAALACVAVLTGCDWGGVSSDESWNDAYSWLNFSGSYTLSDPAYFENDSTSNDSSVQGSAGGSGNHFTGDIPKMGGTIGSGIVPGSVAITFFGGGEHPEGQKLVTLVDDGLGRLTGKINNNPPLGPSTSPQQGDAVGVIVYSTGTFTVNLGTAALAVRPAIRVTYSYYGSKTGSSGVYSVTYLHVTQKGNLFTARDSNGTLFSGRITGASVPKDNYQTPADVRIAFELTSDGGDKIIGNFSGKWNGAASGNSGILSERILNASYYHGGAHDDIVGTASSNISLVPPSMSTDQLTHPDGPLVQ